MKKKKKKKKAASKPAKKAAKKPVNKAKAKAAKKAPAKKAPAKKAVVKKKSSRPDVPFINCAIETGFLIKDDTRGFLSKDGGFTNDVSKVVLFFTKEAAISEKETMKETMADNFLSEPLFTDISVVRARDYICALFAPEFVEMQKSVVVQLTAYRCSYEDSMSVPGIVFSKLKSEIRKELQLRISALKRSLKAYETSLAAMAKGRLEVEVVKVIDVPADKSDQTESEDNDDVDVDVDIGVDLTDTETPEV
jgi:hypothetical protein